MILNSRLWWYAANIYKQLVDRCICLYYHRCIDVHVDRCWLSIGHQIAQIYRDVETILELWYEYMVTTDDIFKCIFSNEDVWILILPKFLPKSSNWQYSRIDSDNGLAPSRRQAIIWTKDDLGNWSVYVSHSLYEMIWTNHESSIYLDKILHTKDDIRFSFQMFWIYNQ